MITPDNHLFDKPGVKVSWPIRTGFSVSGSFSKSRRRRAERLAGIYPGVLIRMVEFRYRPDVDGLRAVAVLLVLFYHARLGCSGGFVGVDVFFVISGYLITGLIIKEQQLGEFSLARFWLRRMRRIVPAAAIMVLFVVIISGFLFLPVHYKDVGKSLLAQSLMLANVYFWRNTGYFDGEADLKPLLHTWSLAVEEQFYLVYPLMLILLQRVSKEWTVGVLASVTAGSFVIAQVGVEQYPAGAFYLLPARAWEMLVGALICFMPSVAPLRGWQLGLLSWLGMGGILAAACLYDSTTAFPGCAALLPCGGTAMFIYVNTGRLTRAGRLLASPYFVFVGLISYSLYLWHWPVLAFLRYMREKELDATTGVLALAVSFLAAYLSWRFVEIPVRRGAVLNSARSLVGAAVAVLICYCSFACLLLQTDGLTMRYNDETRRLLASMEQVEFRHTVPVSDVRSGTLPTFGSPHQSPQVLVWGDSHAMALVPALDKVCRARHIAGVQATHDGTLPLVGFTANRDWAAPPAFASAVLDYVKREKIGVVVLAGYWQRDAERQSFTPCLKRTVESLVSIGCKVVVVRDVPDQLTSPANSVADALRKRSDLSSLGVTLQEHRRYQADADKALMSVADDVLIIDPAPSLLDANARCRVVMDGSCLYWDNHHITVAGALRLAPMFEQAFNSLGMVSRDQAIDNGVVQPVEH